MFLVKKLISQFLMPLPLVLLLGFAGLLLLSFSRRQRTGKTLLWLALLLLAVASTPWLADQNMRALERRYPPITARQPAIDYVVVLGGGHVSEAGLPATSQLAGASLARLAEGIRLQRLHPGSRLLLSGGPVFDPVAEAATMRATALALGVAGREIILEDTSRDTAEQAKNLAPLVRGKRFLLVTSAAHLPRAMALFHGQGLHPVAAPTDYKVRYGQQHGPGRYFPSAGALGRNAAALHERLGLAWFTLRSRMRGNSAP